MVKKDPTSCYLIYDNHFVWDELSSGTRFISRDKDSPHNTLRMCYVYYLFKVICAIQYDNFNDSGEFQ